MGYAGYVPAKYAAKPTAVQLALKELQNEATYELMSKIVKNVVVAPADEKFRRLRLSNSKIAAALTKVPGGLEAMQSLGWQVDPADPDFIILPKSVKPSMAEVRSIEEAKAEWRKDVRGQKRSAAGKALAAQQGGEATRITAQLAADRAERAAQAPVERGSSAQQLPNGGNANIRTAGEAGLNTGGCC